MRHESTSWTRFWNAVQSWWKLAGGPDPGTAGVVKRKRVAWAFDLVTAAVMIPLLWIFPLWGNITWYESCSYSTGVQSCTKYNNTFLFWAWGWWSEKTGWLGTAPYTALAELQDTMAGVLIYAIIATLVASATIAWLITNRSRRDYSSGIMTLFNVIAGMVLVLFMWISNLPSNICGVVQLGTGFASAFMGKWIEPNPREEKWMDDRVKALVARVRDQGAAGKSIDRKLVDSIESELALIEADAHVLGHGCDLKPVREALPMIRARCGMQEVLVGATAIRIDMLRSIANLPGDQFAWLLIDLCNRLDLVIDGGMVKARDGRDIGALVAEVDVLFSGWHAIEASKKAKPDGNARSINPHGE